MQFNKIFRQIVSVFLIYSLVYSGFIPMGYAHLDPPGNPPVQTSIDVVNLIIHDAIVRNFLGGENSALNDGGPVNLPSTNMAELMVLVEIDWGDDHGISYWRWRGDYNFTTHVNTSESRRRWQAIGPRATAGRDYGLVLSFPLPGTSGIQTNIANHMECSPIVTPQFKVRGFEVDKGDSWMSELGAALIDDFVPGGATVGYILTKGLGGLNGNDELAVDVGTPDGQDDPSKPEIEIEFRTSTVEFPPQSGCGEVKVAYLAEPMFTTPYPAETIATPPMEYACTVNDDYFADMKTHYLTIARSMNSDTSLGFAAKTMNASNQPMSLKIQRGYEMAAQFGIDEWHPLGRNTDYASIRFDHLDDILHRLELQKASESELDEAIFMQNQYHARGIVLGVGYIVAARAWTEAKVRLSQGSSIDVNQINQAENLMIQAANTAVNDDDYRGALNLYKQATLILMNELYPSFQSQSQSAVTMKRFFSSINAIAVDGKNQAKFQIVDQTMLDCNTIQDAYYQFANLKLDLSAFQGKVLTAVQAVAQTSNDTSKRPRMILEVTDIKQNQSYTVVDEFLKAGLSRDTKMACTSFFNHQIDVSQYSYHLKIGFPAETGLGENQIQGIELSFS